MLTNRLPRRTFLRAAGVSVALPMLDAMAPLTARGAEKAASPKRMVMVARPLGMHAPFFFPEQAGKDYEPSRYLKLLEPHRGQFTVFSGMSHRGHSSGHGTMAGLLTGVGPEGMRPGDIRNTISLDQEIASQLPADTRYSSLGFGPDDLSWNRKGIRIPSESRATRMFKQLFIAGTPEEIKRELGRIQNGHSILDGVRDQASSLSKQVGAADRNRLDLLLTSIREAEKRLQQDEDWILKPKPVVSAKPYTNDYNGNELIERSRQWYDLTHLALQTDSTRVITVMLWSHLAAVVDGQEIRHHEASHHGHDAAAIERLATIEGAEVAVFGDFLAKLKATDEAGQSLLDRTQIFYASNLGNASAHTNTNLPILVAGGGLKHVGHVAFDRKNNIPLSNLFVRMLQQMDIEMDKFGSSTGMISEV